MGRGRGPLIVLVLGALLYAASTLPALAREIRTAPPCAVEAVERAGPAVLSGVRGALRGFGQLVAIGGAVSATTSLDE